MTDKREAYNQTGFTLIEAVIAMAVLSFGILAFYTMQLTAIRGNASASNITIAATWGMEQIEQLIDTPYDDLEDSDGDGISGAEDTTNPDYKETSADGSYNMYTNVVEDIPIEGCKTIYVLVTDNLNRLNSPVILKYIKEDPI
jgi:prepilin-type N-terminal cleavage/methylation domain-containing protein